MILISQSRRFGRIIFGIIWYLAWKIRWVGRSHTDYRRSVMDARANKDARHAVGGLWDEIGRLQLDVLKELGLLPTDQLLDIGCGSLRGGIPVINYLSRGNYWGTDISPRLLEKGLAQLDDVGLSDKQPVLQTVTDFSLREVQDRKFKYVLAFGVFTDIPQEFVVECLKSVSRILAPDGVFMASFGMAEKYSGDHKHLRYRYPMSFFKGLESETGLEVGVLPDFSFRHPKGHSLLVARQKR